MPLTAHNPRIVYGVDWQIVRNVLDTVSDVWRDELAKIRDEAKTKASDDFKLSIK